MTISHLRPDTNINNRWIPQSNEEHSIGVAEMAKRFASEFGMGDFGYVMGMLHDKGKEKNEFQEYIQDVNGIPGHKNWTQQGKTHAYVGGVIAKEILKSIYPLIGNPIMGHHRGLYDYTELMEEENKEIPTEVNIPSKENFPFSLPKWFSPSVLQPKDFHHVERMLFSCLVDADYLDTERFMQPNQYALREGKNSLKELLPRLDTFLAKFGEPTTEVNKIRSEIQQRCLTTSGNPSGFYSLTVPTGGGKTLSSLVWAINHAIKHSKKRIIIAIPYTSIIVQTASVLRNIFGEENVLEHHSNTTLEEGRDSELINQMKLATENWNYPIIVTTNVQLFESMFSNKSSNCRKLHNICNSVLILDEVQTLPMDFLQPIVDTLDTYQRVFGVSVLFTTASLPVLEGNHQGVLRGLKHIEEIIPAEWKLHDRLRRVSIDINKTPQTYDEIAQKLIQHNRVLCIVNTRLDAKEIFDRLPDDGIRIHLSRMMCPMHLSEKIREMKEAIANPENKIVRVVSTQLIEAGVDIDFPVVYRQEAGLDSVLQAAGRCNREGKLPCCPTYVFSLTAEHALPKGYITQCNNARLNMGNEHDWFSPEAMKKYFYQLYARIQTFDKKDINHYLYKMDELMFEKGALEFQLIDDTTISVLVNWKGSLQLLNDLKQDGPSYALMKKLSQYSVNIRKFNFDKLLTSGCIEEVIEGFYVIKSEKQYNKHIGLISDNQIIEEALIL
ncbi:MAG: CRISPR-associated helicase Cas3' [Bacteroidaceae bacterium]|nr:CRISPR-associated helicase Cas3' [Bacteroidaceae bacterium]